MKNKEFVEDCWYLFGIRLGRYFLGYRKYSGSGTAAEVSFDYDIASSRWVVGWYHTHPGIKHINPSGTDNKTMRSWVKSFYKPYLCGIVCNEHENCFCYYVKGLDKENVTIVGRKKIKITFFNNLFIAKT